MIKFIDKDGNVFDGCSPYIHWYDGEQSTNMQYIQKIYIVSDSDYITVKEKDDSDEIKLISPDRLSQTDNVLSDLLTSQYTYDGVEYENSFFVYQLLFVCRSNQPSQITKEFSVTSGYGEFLMTDTMIIGGDFYDLDEILEINLGNRGLEIPITIQKAFLKNNIQECMIDNILINRKFKELISNYLDIIDCKGSYKSLYNSLKWFEWGDQLKIYEMWQKEDGGLFQKELSILLNEEYESLLTTCKKTTHIALSALTYSHTGGLDEEKNPEIENLPYQWSNDIISLKISLLGAFFERYFMPIHLDLKKATIESLVYTTRVKVKSSTLPRVSSWIDDTGVVEIDMQNIITLGNIDGYSVGKNTVFGIQPEDVIGYGEVEFIKPIGVEPLELVENDATDYESPDDDYNIGMTFTQLVGGVGAIIPIIIKIHLPNDERICKEILTIKSSLDTQPRQITEHRLWVPEDGIVTIPFSLISTEEEVVNLSFVFYSTSGHTWTAATSYKTIDVSGSQLKIYKITNTDNTTSSTAKYTTEDDWMKGNPYQGQYLYSDNENTYIQYLPMTSENKSQYNEFVLVDNTGADITDGWSKWATVTNKYWVLYRGEELTGRTEPQKYTMLIGKKGGNILSTKINFENTYNISTDNIERFDYVYVPQLHEYTDIENIPLTTGSDGKKIMTENDYLVKSSDLLCVYPQFRKTIEADVELVKWEFKNMSTLETIEYTHPISTPIIANNHYKALTPGFWSVTMYYKISDTGELHKLSKNSVFRVI